MLVLYADFGVSRTRPRLGKTNHEGYEHNGSAEASTQNSRKAFFTVPRFFPVRKLEVADSWEDKRQCGCRHPACDLQHDPEITRHQRN